MIVDWTTPARRDMARIWEFNETRSLERAERIDDSLIAGAAGLLGNPYKGRPGERDGMRELSLPAIQYVLIYEVDGDAVCILRVWSTAERCS